MKPIVTFDLDVTFTHDSMWNCEFYINRRETNTMTQTKATALRGQSVRVCVVEGFDLFAVVS